MWGDIQGGVKNDIHGFAGLWVAGGAFHLVREQRRRRLQGEKEKSCFRHGLF